MKRKRIINNITGYGFVMPALIILLVFTIIPIFMTFYYSLTDYNGFKAPVWDGIGNYIKLLDDVAVKAAIKNTFIFTLFSVPIQIGMALIIGALLAARYRNGFGELVRGSLFVPVLCSFTLIGVIFSQLFAPTDDSFFNLIAQAIGLGKINWLGSKNTALYVLIFVHSWKSVGYYLVILYAGIMDIPNDLYEASAIDGASKLQQFFKITIPNLKSVLFMVIIICTIWTFQAFDLCYTMTAGGPGNATTTLTHQIYTQSFKNMELGYGCAIGVVLFAFIILINLIQRIFLKNED